MGIEIIGAIIATLIGALVPALKALAKEYLEKSVRDGKKSKFQNLIAKTFDLEFNEPKTYKQRLGDTLTVLKNAFTEVDKATVEFSELMKEKEKNIDAIEKRLAELTEEETTLKDKVHILQKVPLEALTHFEEILNKGDKRSALRDYLLFISGIVLSVIVTLILKFYFNI